ncbi:hypothetical protein ACM64Y_00685 [Novispirillum sp. DQ9]|uniref:hypothetical protein n=1 Tax=Novispirillum sp. DQ9 TaxID=3398612 RepID=UPI003C7B2A69
MADAPLTPSGLLTILAIIGSVGGLWWRISALIEASRVESSQGRKDLYKHIDGLTEKMVRRDLYERDLQAMQQRNDEQDRLIASLAGRVCPYPPKE